MNNSQMPPSSDEWRCDGMLLREIQTTHSFTAEPIPAAALMKIVEDTLNLTTTPYQSNVLDNSMLEDLGPIIHKISCEIPSNCSVSQGSLKQRTLNLLILLERFNWEAKIAITLAGFATNYAESFLIDEVYTDKTTAKGLQKLKGLGQKNTRSNGSAVQDIVKNVTNIIKYILAIKKIQDKVSTVPIHDNDFQSASFWIIYAVLICSSEISGHGVIEEQVNSIKTRIDVICQYFSLKLMECQRLELMVEYELFGYLFGSRHTDNMAILKLLLCCEENEELVCGMDKEKKINLSVLKTGTVIVLLSSLYIDTYSEEVSLIKAFCNKTNTNNQYHIVWLPIGYKEEKHRITYAKVVDGKPWYYLSFESLRKQNVVLDKYARKEWSFNEKPMLMVLDNGQVIHHDALSLIHTWGRLAFPFRVHDDLWKKYGNSLGIQFIVDFLHNDLTIQKTGGTSQYVCVFGGRWPQKSGDETKEKEEVRFADLAGKLMAATIPANIELKMAYLWANEEEAALERNINTNVELTITNDPQYKKNMQYVQVEKTSTKIFWSRAESIALQLTMKEKNGTLDENMKALLENTESLLKFNVLSTAWVAIGQLGKNDMIFHDAEKFSSCLVHIDENLIKWKEELDSNSRDLIKTLRGWLKGVYEYKPKPIEKHCFKHVVHGDGMQKGGMHCVVCNEPMRKVVLYECCNEKED